MLEKQQPFTGLFADAPIFTVLKPYAGELLPFTTIHSISKTEEEILYMPGSPAQYLYAVLQGRIHVQNFDVEGRLFPVYHATAGKDVSLFGFESVMKRLNGQNDEDLIHDQQAVPFSDSVLARFDARAITQVLRKEFRNTSKNANPFFLYFINQLRQSEKQTSELAMGIQFGSLTQRIVSLLIDLHSTFGDHISIKHQDIAEWLVSRRESVTSLMVNLSTTGVIEQGVGHITICDIEGLKRVQKEATRDSNFKRRSQRGRVYPPQA